MKILQIISSLASGGAENYVRDLSISMSHDGHEICIAYISDAASLNRSLEYQSEFQSQLSVNNVSYFELGHGCRQKLWRGAAQLRQVIKGFKPDIIHSHLYYGVFFTALSGWKGPLIYTHHSQNLGKGRYLYPLLNCVVDRFVGISKDCANTLAIAGAKEISVIYNGVDAQRLKTKKEWLIKENLEIISVGRLFEPKNYTLLINVMAVFFKRNTNLENKVSLVIVGEGPLKEKLQQQISDLKLTNQITLFGNSNNVPALLHNADIFVMSSAWEGVPIALLEAMMTGLPIIATDVGGCRDVVEECLAGVIVPPGNVIDFSKALEKMVLNDSFRKKCADNSLEKSQKYNISEAANKHIEMYAEILGSRSF
jgi:glycosyltransferase involved in cell wall biosynthesis